ncbi:MAG: tRNA (guanosine(46)-N7)-methyltransferase TrmB [Salinivirgaceae bacterium]|nr:tRNA (guanosine(46)-N7)-methyltransferase TrmB [Salinivirgaceae bacterium]
MGKGKLAKFRENETFANVFQPEVSDFTNFTHELKGTWHSSVFKNNNPIVLELGCGKGEYTVGMARMFPDKNFIGVDIKGARIWTGAKASNLEQMSNVAFLRTRIEIIRAFFAPGEVSEIWITFPDPQMKKRRAKKRLTSSLFLTMYQQLLADNGFVNLKTDSRFLYKYSCEVAAQNGLEIVRQSADLYSEPWIDDVLGIKTYYEQLHIDDGNTIHYLKFRLPASKPLIEPDFDGEID